MFTLCDLCRLERIHGTQYAQHVEDAHRALEHYVVSLNIEAKDRTALLEVLEQSEIFYEAQFGEAKIVTNVCFIY